MKALRQISFACLTAAGLIGVAGMASAQSQGQGQGRDNAQGPVCTVTVERDQPSGVFDVTRQEFEDGSCNCFIYTGPQTQRDNVEAQVANVVRTQRCPAARPMSVQGPGPGPVAGASNFRVANPLVPIVLFAGAGAGIIIGIENDDGDDDGDVGVSP
ncbi:hypothetical protein [Aurantiacibacter hainanensis]|uniref:hypothetical protein n=1 Tax=Aurantiacibacter hainanensis TaxID=3076114 RepID=UPI0030C69CFF